MPPGKVATFGRNTPIGRAAQPDELAPPYVMLAKRLGRATSWGAVIAVTGGRPFICCASSLVLVESRELVGGSTVGRLQLPRELRIGRGQLDRVLNALVVIVIAGAPPLGMGSPGNVTAQ
ncbi:hypothetical protein AB5I41_12280 [Sphingomonas sp. MMS24-JH45]